MTHAMPPVPPASRSDKGPSDAAAGRAPQDTTPAGKQVPQNLDQQGQSGNTRINTTRDGGLQGRI